MDCIYTQSKSDNYGRYLVAKKNIKQGQLILKENPILLCPQVGGPLICFNCCAQLKKLYFCQQCSLAVLCKPECYGSFHDSDECDAFKATTCITHEDILTNPELATPLRCLTWRLCKKELFERFSQLESHLEQRQDSQIWRRIRTNVEKVLEKLGYLTEEDLKEDLVQKIGGILDINTFDVRQPQRNRTGLGCGDNLRGLYPEAALMAHNCVANAHLAVDDDFVLYIHAAVDIPEGCPIFFNYTNALQGSEERRVKLLEGKHFECLCLRCIDSTELETEMSSIKCPRCRKGFIKPRPWQCSHCKVTFKDSLIKMTITEGKRRVEELEHFDIETLESSLLKLSLTFHPHHYLILEIEQNLIRLYTQAPPNVQNLRRKIYLCENLLEIFKILEPGISRIQAIVMYELHSAQVGLAQKLFANEEIDQHELSRKLLQAENNLKNSIKYLLYEPVNSPEGRLAQNALYELKSLRSSIGNLSLASTKEKRQNKKTNKKK